jgi:hypothetical protein
MKAFAFSIGNLIYVTVVSLIIQAAIFWLLQRRRALGEVTGDWKSTYQGIEEVEGTWVIEKVRIEKTLRLSSGTLRSYRLKNRESSRGYDYLAIGAVSKKDYLIGDWESTKPDGTGNRGIFALTVAPHGNMMYGYWAGQDTSGAHRFGRWVLVKEINNGPSLEFAKNRLSEMRKSGPFLDFDSLETPPKNSH